MDNSASPHGFIRSHVYAYWPLGHMPTNALVYSECVVSDILNTAFRIELLITISQNIFQIYNYHTIPTHALYICMVHLYGITIAQRIIKMTDVSCII